MNKVYVFDPTASDEMSRVRGIGRYLQILKENFENDWVFTSHLQEIPSDAVFINPFLNFLQSPLPLPKTVKKIAVIHDLIPLKYPQHFPVGLRGKLNIFLNKHQLKKYDSFITDSVASKKNLESILEINPEKIQVIYPIVSKKFLMEKTITKIDLPNKYCVYVGDATWNKNLVNIARAIKEINVTCMFVGRVFQTEDSLDHPWQKELKEFLRMTNDDKRFIFYGFATDDALVQLYKNALCNILVSQDEGFGFSYLEAAQFGTPSVLSKIAVLQETALDSALFADPENYTDIANQIGELYFNENTRTLFGRKAAHRREFFTSEKFKNAFSSVWT